MTPADVRDRVAAITKIRGDDERAHEAEDALHADVLFAIAHGNARFPAACAREALKSHDIRFARWYA